MWYVLEDTVPANTSYANRRETKIKVSGGVLHRVIVTIPPGSANLVKAQLKTGSYFILPRNEDKSISGEHVNVPYPEWLELKTAENNLTLITWSPNTDNEHTVRFLIGVLPKKIMEIEERILKDLQMWLRLFKRRD